MALQFQLHWVHSPLFSDEILLPSENDTIVIYDLSLEHQSNFEEAQIFKVLSSMQIKIVLVDFPPVYNHSNVVYYYFSPVIPYKERRQIFYGFKALLMNRSVVNATKNQTVVNFIMGEKFILNKSEEFGKILPENIEAIFWHPRKIGKVSLRSFKELRELEDFHFFVVKFGQIVYELLYLNKMPIVLNEGLSEIDLNVCHFLVEKGLIVFIDTPTELLSGLIQVERNYPYFLDQCNKYLSEEKVIFPSEFRFQ